MKKYGLIKKLKGFTLIELLAVIVILAIILLVAMPILLSVINEAKKGAFQASAMGLLKTAENEYMKNVLNGVNEPKIYVFENYVQVEGDKLEFSGQGPKTGYIYVSSEGEIIAILEDENWFAKKEINQEDFTIEKLNEEVIKDVFHELVGTVYKVIYAHDEGECELNIFEVEHGQLVGAPVCTRENYLAGNFEIIDGDCAGIFSELTGECSEVKSDITVKVNWLCQTPFGSNPSSFSGVDFYDGTPSSGMIVFKTVGSYSLTPLCDIASEVLIVAGGGAGGANVHDGGGGGGGGGLIYSDDFMISSSATTIIVGDGGLGHDNNNLIGNKGEDSIFGLLVAEGGGGGGSRNVRNGGGGGSGGGGGAAYYFASGIGGEGVISQGYRGGDNVTIHGHAAGGGGAGASGGNDRGGLGGGAGGIGLSYYGFYYAGGGGGGYGGAGGLGGGGGGAVGVGLIGVGISNTGGGGGGDYNNYGGGLGSGGSGIIIVRWGGYNKNYNPTTNAVW